ncbi:hypothetical protein ACJW31_05G110600 [Castanea mollissima]
MLKMENGKRSLCACVCVCARLRVKRDLVKWKRCVCGDIMTWRSETGFGWRLLGCWRTMCVTEYGVLLLRGSWGFSAHHALALRSPFSCSDGRSLYIWCRVKHGFYVS